MSRITLDSTYTDVRGGGYGRDAWIAKIVGPDLKYGLKREFARKDTSGLSRSGRSGTIRFDMDGPGIYEFKNFCIGSTSRNWEWNGFIELLADGSAHEMSRAAVISRFSAEIAA